MMYRSAFQCQCLWTTFCVTFVLAVNLCMTGCLGMTPVQASDDKTEILAEVVSVSPLQTGETVQRKRWVVNLRVQRVLRGARGILPGEMISVHIHSVAQTFGVDLDTIKGKTFQIQYSDAFAKDYNGTIEVDLSGGWGSGCDQWSVLKETFITCD